MNGKAPKEAECKSRRDTGQGAWIRCALLVLLLLFPALNGNARVFWRWRSAETGTRALQSAGGTIAYETDIALNGGRGRMTVFRFAETLEEVAATLRKVFNTPNITSGANSTMSVGVIRAAGHVLRLVLVAPLSGQGTVVFQFDQSQAEAGRSRNPPHDPVPDVPAYPDAETRFHVREDNTKTDFAVFLSNAQPADIVDFYATRLSADGWMQPLPLTAGRPGRPGMLLFEKQNALCCVYVAREKSTGQTKIAVMHKEIGLP